MRFYYWLIRDSCSAAFLGKFNMVKEDFHTTEIRQK